MRAGYDAARTTDENTRHWANADAMSADAAASPSVRRTIRNRARYEVANSSLARGIVLTLANDVVGAGPRLQMLTNSAELNRAVEAAFSAWQRAAGLAAKLRTMRMARASDGEAFALLVTNPALPGAVKLDLSLIEADQVATPDLFISKPGAVDGIRLDPLGNPVAYTVLRDHPGSGSVLAPTLAYDAIAAEFILHWFRADRPGQHRGLPDIMPALNLFAVLRRYVAATVLAAELVADQSLVFKTGSPPNGQAATVGDGESLPVMEIERGVGMFCPEGWEPFQIKAEQPVLTFVEFRKAIINEIARCLNMPLNVAACDSSDYNYASGRMDHQTYFKSIRVDQIDLEEHILDRVLSAWLTEAIAAGAMAELANQAAEEISFKHCWFWDGREHVDPAKEANAQAQRLTSNTTTLAAEFARAGKDWETELRQRAAELNLCRELGIPTAADPSGSAAADNADDDADERPARRSGRQGGRRGEEQ